MNQNIKIKSIRHAVPQATPSGGPARDEQSEQLVSASHQYGFRNKFGMTKGAESSRSTPTCHPWTSVSEIRGSTWCGLNAPHFTRFAQSGRSMVEMLGVLAVIGVLSIAGVGGYTAAMKRHRANELLNEASKRAAIIAAQAMAGKTGEISLSEFGNNSVSGVTFSKAEIKDNHIVLTLSGSGLVDICGQLKNATGDNTVMKITKDDCSELTFNADMSAGSSGTEPQNNGCTNGQYRCESGAVQKCVGGTWTLTTDSGKVCNGDVAENIHCNSENHLKTRCRNGVYQLCHWEGPGEFYNETPPAGKICDGDNLVDNPDAKCTVGDARCRDGDYEECKQDGNKTRWIAWDMWPEGYLCEGDTLVEEVGSCIQDSQRCLNSIHYWCDEGQWHYEPISYLVECEGDHFVCVEEGQKTCGFYLPIRDYTYLECQNGELTPITPPAGMSCEVDELWYEGCTDKTGAYHCENGYYMHYDNNPGVCIVEQPPAGKKCDGNTLVDA